MEQGLMIISQIIGTNFPLFKKKTSGLQPYAYHVEITSNLDRYESETKYSSQNVKKKRKELKEEEI